MGSAFSSTTSYSDIDDTPSSRSLLEGWGPSSNSLDSSRPSLARPPSFRDLAQASADKVVKRSNSLRDLFAAGQDDSNKDVILVEAELLQTELNQLCATLKKQIIEITETMTERREQAQFLNDVTSILVSSQIGSLEAERRQVMHSIDYLQKVEIDLRIQMDDYKENPVLCPTINIPTYQEVMDHVQDRLANEIVPSDMEFHQKQQRQLAKTKPKPRFEKKKAAMAAIAAANTNRPKSKRRPPPSASSGTATTASGESPVSIGPQSQQSSNNNGSNDQKNRTKTGPSGGKRVSHHDGAGDSAPKGNRTAQAATSQTSGPPQNSNSSSIKRATNGTSGRGGGAAAAGKTSTAKTSTPPNMPRNGVNSVAAGV